MPFEPLLTLALFLRLDNAAVVITFCLVLVEMQPMESHDVMTNRHAVEELCARQSTKLAEAHESAHEAEGHHSNHTTGVQLEMSCEVQWCTFDETAIVGGAILSPLCIPDCEVTGACTNFTKGCSIDEALDEASHTMVELTDENSCREHGGTWGRSFLQNYLLRYNWPKAQTHLAASFVLMTMWFVSIGCACTSLVLHSIAAGSSLPPVLHVCGCTGPSPHLLVAARGW
jgi:hypothetical protein